MKSSESSKLQHSLLPFPDAARNCPTVPHGVTVRSSNLNGSSLRHRTNTISYILKQEPCSNFQIYRFISRARMQSSRSFSVQRAFLCHGSTANCRSCIARNLPTCGGAVYSIGLYTPPCGAVLRRKNADAFFSSQGLCPCRGPAANRWSRIARNLHPERSYPLNGENLIHQGRELRAFSRAHALPAALEASLLVR